MSGRHGRRIGLETVDLDGLCIQAQAFLLIGQELLNILALVALELNHLAHLRVGNDGAIAGELLLDDLEDLLLVEFLGETLHRGQRFTTIAFCLLLARLTGARDSETNEGTSEGGSTYAGCECGCSSDWQS